MTTEERLENMERELARAKRRNRWLLICVAVCLGMIFAWAFLAQPGLPGTTQAPDPANPNEDEITKLQTDISRLQAVVILLKREDERLRKELDEAKKDKSAAAPTDAQGPSAPQPAAPQPPGPDKPPTAVRIPGLPETDSSWWRDAGALANHMKLRVSMSATNPQASVWMWLQRHNHFAEKRVEWKVEVIGDLSKRSRYFDKEIASIEYYKCLGIAEKHSKSAEFFRNGTGPPYVKRVEEEEASATRFRAEAKAWKILMDAGGGLSLQVSAVSGPETRHCLYVHLVLPGQRFDSDPTYSKFMISRLFLVEGKIVSLGTHSHAVLTGRISSVPVD